MTPSDLRIPALAACLEMHNATSAIAREKAMRKALDIGALYAEWIIATRDEKKEGEK